MRSSRPVAPDFAPLGSGNGVVVRDPIERRRFRLHTPSAVDPRPVGENPFPAPVDSAAVVETSAVRVDELVDAVVRDDAGTRVLAARPGTDRELDDGTYHVELSGPIKCYLEARGPMTVRGGVSELRFEFEESTPVVVGVRSYHDRPATTLTVADRPRALLTVLPELASALKTTDCERSYPTLRGHPPRVEVADHTDVPEALDPPETGVRLELTPTVESALVAAPLVYYLGADVVPADRRRLVTDSGFARPLEGDRPFADEVSRVLRQTFFLDCLTRTEGYHGTPLHERDRIESDFDFDLDFERLYGAPLAAQVERYLDVPFEAIEPHLPAWPLAAHLPPDVERAEALPYVVNELAVVRTADPRPLDDAEIRSRLMDEYDPPGDSAGSGSRRTRGSNGPLPDDRIVELDQTDAVDDAWFGPAVPFRATKATTTAYRNRFERDPDGGPIEIAVVCNDHDMAAESDEAAAVYGSREALPFDVTLRRNLDGRSLRDLLAADVDFLHYVGHVSADGFHCTDETVDAATVDGVGVDAFFLNACCSSRQGLALVEGGAVGGVATTSEVNESGAVTVGRTIARLLNLGFPLRAALTLAREQSIVGGHYVVVGDGNVAVTAAKNGVPLLCHVTESDGETRELGLEAFLPMDFGVGATACPTLDGNDRHYLIPGLLDRFRVGADELAEYLTWHPYPVRKNGELLWNEQLEPADR